MRAPARPVGGSDLPFVKSRGGGPNSVPPPLENAKKCSVALCCFYPPVEKILWPASTIALPMTDHTPREASGLNSPPHKKTTHGVRDIYGLFGGDPFCSFSTTTRGGVGWGEEDGFAALPCNHNAFNNCAIPPPPRGSTLLHRRASSWSTSLRRVLLMKSPEGEGEKEPTS